MGAAINDVEGCREALALVSGDTPIAVAIKYEWDGTNRDREIDLRLPGLSFDGKGLSFLALNRSIERRAFDSPMAVSPGGDGRR